MGHVLLHIYCVEAQSIEQSGDAGPGVLPRFVENAVGERGLGNLLLGGQAYLGFEVQIRLDKQAGRPGIDFCAPVIDARGKHLRRGQSNVDGIALLSL